MVGNWTLNMHMLPDARHAPNSDMRGFETVRPALNGNAIIGNLELQGPNNMSFKGHLVITPNKTGGDRGHAATNAKPEIRTQRMRAKDSLKTRAPMRTPGRGRTPA